MHWGLELLSGVGRPRIGLRPRNTVRQSLPATAAASLPDGPGESGLGRGTHFARPAMDVLSDGDELRT